MREYILYVKEMRATYKAMITPCFSLDRTFWEQQDGSQLHILGKSTSLALVFALRQQVQLLLATQVRFEQLLSQIRIHLHNYLHELNRQLPGKDTFTFIHQQRDTPTKQEPPKQQPQEQRKSPKQLLEQQQRVQQPQDQPLPNDPHERFFGQHVNQTSTTYVIHSQAMKLALLLSGRSLLLEEIEYSTGLPTETIIPSLQWLVLTGVTEWQPGVTVQLQKSWWRHRALFACQRCGAGSEEVLTVDCQSCGQPCAYCPICFTMGRSRCCAPYICIASHHSPRPDTPFSTSASQIRINEHSNSGTTTDHSLLKWNGSFSVLQADAAQRALDFVRNPSNLSKPASPAKPANPAFLIWAVCGAGKTELIFPAVNEVLMKGGKVLLATPRKDVVLELVPRLRKVFPDVTIRAAYGSSKEKWEEGQFIISTTHQTMRFYQAFQLVIVDEVDAFPFHNNRMLYRAVERARKPEGKLIYLSATPPTYLRKQLVPQQSGLSVPHSATHVLIPQRYHGFPLPIPQLLMAPRWQKKLQLQQRMLEVNSLVGGSLQENRQVFIFVPRVADIEPVLHYFQSQFPEYSKQMEGVHAADELREAKVLEFRNRNYRLLVTTTILERGVTIPRSDVVVLGADEAVFDEASLVQIAGRVGRSADSPDGHILFVVKDRSKSPLLAIKQIREMNELASRHLLASTGERR